ncbi:MAG: hypothetical protein HYY37_03030 [Candidatus Aenigmarchaeota archaeon]|nr:hypothetical protein [Candidatus Aenigmarchaeota archaeon]
MVPAERYKKMQEKFQLPHLTELRQTFKIEIDENGEIIDQIRNEISDHLFTFTERIIEPIISGSEALCCLYEQGMLTKEEKQRLFELYRQIQSLKWENNLLLIRHDDKATAKWIRKTWDFWNEDLEKDMTKLCKKLSASWKDLRFKKERTSYHG